ncbi:MAG: hypothetical protein KC425_04885, partial [Anaerolineales bacterium]|nr:hypothetical protein [Anaerolineales bacterium]
MTKVLRMALLGPVEVTRAGAPLDDLVSAKARALLYYLAVTERPHSRQALAGLLWGSLPEADARRNLRGALLKLRQDFEPYIHVSYQELAFDPAPGVWLDVAQFRAALAAPAETAVADLQAALDLYRGEFLQDFHVRQAPDFDTWLAAQQTRLRDMALAGCYTLAERCIAGGAYAQGVRAAQLLLRLDPLREEGYRQLMLLLALQGQRGAALAQYERCR